MKVHCLSFCVCRKDDQRYSNVCNVKKIFIYQVSEGLPLQSSVESLCLDLGRLGLILEPLIQGGDHEKTSRNIGLFLGGVKMHEVGIRDSNMC